MRKKEEGKKGREGACGRSDRRESYKTREGMEGKVSSGLRMGGEEGTAREGKVRSCRKGRRMSRAEKGREKPVGKERVRKEEGRGGG